jgi:hypothetical protein
MNTMGLTTRAAMNLIKQSVTRQAEVQAEKLSRLLMTKRTASSMGLTTGTAMNLIKPSMATSQAVTS